ncbi:MAG: hypothetical protein H7122_13630 [Chitinophagaceae bacterium]|nr:hypothetical protein [Chitinophagaceae bacterium]
MQPDKNTNPIMISWWGFLLLVTGDRSNLSQSPIHPINHGVPAGIRNFLVQYTRMKILWLLLLLGYHGFTQTGEESKTNAGDYEGISGNPYFLKDWSEGTIRFSSGKVTDKFKLKFNVAQNRLLLQFSGSTFAAESKVSEFVMYTRNKKDSFVFRKGFPGTDRGNPDTYYQILETGQVSLLRLAIKDVVAEKEILASKLSRHYFDVDQYYLLQNGAMRKIDKDTTPLQDILADRREELKTYISEQQLKMRTAEDLTKVVKKYNELRQ